MVNRVREIRLEKGLTLVQLAERIGTTPTQLSRLEKGVRSLNNKWLQDVAKALDVAPGDLLTSSDREKAIRLLSPKDTVAPFTDQMYFLTACFEFVCRERDRLSDRAREFLSPRRCMFIAASVSRSFFDLFVSLGRADELYATIRFYILRDVHDLAHKEGLAQVAAEAEKLRNHEFARLDPATDDVVSGE